MTKPFARFIALLLVPCLMADTLLAFALGAPCTTRSDQTLFQEEAIVDPVISPLKFILEKCAAPATRVRMFEMQLVVNSGHLLPLEDGKVWYSGPSIDWRTWPHRTDAAYVYSDALVFRRAFRHVPYRELAELIEFSKTGGLTPTGKFPQFPFLVPHERKIVYTDNGVNYRILEIALNRGYIDSEDVNFAVYTAEIDGKIQLVVSPETHLVKSVSRFQLSSTGRLLDAGAAPVIINSMEAAVNTLDLKWLQVRQNLNRLGFESKLININVEVANHRYAEETYFDADMNTVTIKITPSNNPVLQQLKVLKGVANLAHTPKEALNKENGITSELFTLYPFVRAAFGMLGLGPILSALGTLGIDGPLRRLFYLLGVEMGLLPVDDPRLPYDLRDNAGQKRWIKENPKTVHGLILEFLIIPSVIAMLDRKSVV
jgi:hypothetical protein